MRVLVVNAGSSSLKLRLLEPDDRLSRSADLPADAGGFDTDRMGSVLRTWPPPDVVGHRVVHGGADYTSAVRLDAGVRERLDALTALAPLHQPKSLTALDAVSAALPDVAAVACFDTAFHSTLPPEATTYAIPAEWRQRHGVRRYGFHGLSHAWSAQRAAALGGSAARVVSCHLGAGASLCAIVGGRSVDTTMGFTPLEGLVMATRSGTVDPGLVLWLEEHEHLRPHAVAIALEQRSGLLALAGTADMRAIVSRADRGEQAARGALDVYLHRLAGAIAAMAAAARGLDVLVFTGGIGENSAAVRALTTERLGWLGVELDGPRNAAVDVRAADADITAADGSVRVLVIAAREDLQIAREARAVVAPFRRPCGPS